MENAATRLFAINLLPRTYSTIGRQGTTLEEQVIPNSVLYCLLPRTYLIRHYERAFLWNFFGYIHDHDQKPELYQTFYEGVCCT